VNCSAGSGGARTPCARPGRHTRRGPDEYAFADLMREVPAAGRARWRARALDAAGKADLESALRIFLAQKETARLADRLRTAKPSERGVSGRRGEEEPVLRGRARQLPCGEAMAREGGRHRRVEEDRGPRPQASRAQERLHRRLRGHRRAHESGAADPELPRAGAPVLLGRAPLSGCALGSGPGLRGCGRGRSFVVARCRASASVTVAPANERSRWQPRPRHGRDYDAPGHRRIRRRLASSAASASSTYGALSKTERRTRALPRIHQPVRTMWSSRASLEFKKPCKLLRQAWA
jgi:hypothetical protein